MEENNTQPSEDTGIGVVENVAPPQPMKPESKGGRWIPIVVLLLVIIAAGGWFLLKGQGEGGVSSPMPSPLVQPAATEAPTPTSTATPKPVDKKNVSVEILNGTGISGEAAYLQGVMKELGFSKIQVGNSTVQDATTTQVVYSSTLSSALMDEVTAKLKEVYKVVETKTTSGGKVDIQIITGLRKNQTARPSATATAKTSATPTGSPIPSTTASPSPSASPTANP